MEIKRYMICNRRDKIRNGILRLDLIVLIFNDKIEKGSGNILLIEWQNVDYRRRKELRKRDLGRSFKWWFYDRDRSR